MKGYFKYNIVENSFLLFTIAFLAGISYIFFRKDTERKKITIFSTAITISALIFSLTTMIGTQNGQCSFEHFGIRLMTKIYLFNVVLSLLGWLISKLRYNSIKTYTVLLTFIFLFVTYKPISYIDEQYIEQSQQLKRRIFILERIFDLYGKDNKIYVWAFNNFCLLSPPAHLEYFLYLYDRENEYKNFDEYKPVKLCTNSDSYDDCDKKLVQFLKEKTGHELTEEEISKHNFQKYYKY